MIAIVDFGIGNLGSIHNICRYIGVETKIVSEISDIKKASKIIMPGVGSFDTAMQRIHERNLEDVLSDKALIEQIPFLGICLGMQLLTNGSEEGKIKGLGWIPGATLSFKNRIEKKLKIPHMGWNTIRESNPNPLFTGFDEFDESKFYFVHSYYVAVQDQRNSILKTSYGLEFDSAIQKDNIFGVQFHPEKSHKYGMQLFKNFAKI